VRIVAATGDGDTESVAGHSIHRHMMIFPCHPLAGTL
jgi:hypothetical protein